MDEDDHHPVTSFLHPIPIDTDILMTSRQTQITRVF